VVANAPTLHSKINMEKSTETVNRLTREVSGAMLIQDILSVMIYKNPNGSTSSGPTRHVPPLTGTAESAGQNDLDLEAVVNRGMEVLDQLEDMD